MSKDENIRLEKAKSQVETSFLGKAVQRDRESSGGDAM